MIKGAIMMQRHITLGIDAGGTFTDLVLFDPKTKSVVSSAKTPTFHDNMLRSLSEGIELITKDINISYIKSVNLATTFATNAIVENRMRPVSLILIGYTQKQVQEAKSENKLGIGNTYVVKGGHNQNGDEIEPLDEESLLEIITMIPDDTEGIAVSGYFSVRNPDHELRVINIIKEKRPDLFVTSGHELTWELNAYKRATTASLNAGLIPIIIKLIDSLSDILDEKGIHVPLSIIRGDGTIVAANWAKLHPVEMILSGPAASAVGAGFLASNENFEKESWIVDIGGTTTDIIALDANNKPVISKGGVTVGLHNPLVKSIDIRTFGQGGDSLIRYDIEENITIGPMRVKPLCVLACEYPETLRNIKALSKESNPNIPLFILPGLKRKTDDKIVLKLTELAEQSPVSLRDIRKEAGLEYIFSDYIIKLSEQGYFDLSAFTPTDAAHILCEFERWNKEASHLGACALLVNQNISAFEFSKRVIKKMAENIALETYKKSINSLIFPQKFSKDIEDFLRKSLENDHLLYDKLNLVLKGILIGAGAPAYIFTEKISELLNCRHNVASESNVAGAVGAAVGTFSYSGVITISKLEEGLHRAHLPRGIVDFRDLEEAVTASKEMISEWLVEQSNFAGVSSPCINIQRNDIALPGQSPVWTELTYSVAE